MKEFPKKHWSALVVLVIAAVAVVAVYVAGTGKVLSSGSRTAHVRPYEYMYLDSARVDTYLGQLNDGDIGSENRTVTASSSANAGLQVDTLGSAAASTSSERTTSAVVTFSEADRFYRLLDDLQKDDALLTLPAGAAHLRPQLAQRLTEGSMVRIENAQLHLPPYLSVYPQLRYALYQAEPESGYREQPQEAVFGEAPFTRFALSEEILGRAVRAQRAAFIARVGGNPRLPFATSVDGRTVVVPARFASLTGDPSLLSGHVTVVGKLALSGMRFGDGVSAATFLPALIHAPEMLLRDLGVREKLLANVAREARRTHRSRVTLLHKYLFNALQRSLSYRGQVLEVIPVAIYE